METNFYRIGVIFTSLDWAIFASKRFGIYNSWMNGATIFDPTMGSGNLLAALIQIGCSEGVPLDQMPIHNLYGNELNSGFHKEAIDRFRQEFRVDMTSNFTQSDIFDLEPAQYDIVFGNPPWMNFTDLPDKYKEQLKSIFIEYDLVENTRKMLLGSARVDIAALVIQKSIAEFLVPGGKAYFFQPLSLLLNDGAHDSFRRYSVKDINFSIEEVYDFNETTIFPDVSTRNGLVHYQRNKKAQFPVSYFRYIEKKWIEQRASPILSSTGPLSVFRTDSLPPLFNFKPIPLQKSSRPRQGINTSGANRIFFFNSYEDIDAETCRVNESVLLPKIFVFPLLVCENFRDVSSSPKKWVLLPYSKSGRPLELKTIQSHPLLWEYLIQNQEFLSLRKGKMIQTWIERGYWWALLGVGKYNFIPHKVVWEAYGRKTFEPTIFSGRWQVNQSLQAYISLSNKKESLRVLSALNNPVIEHYLHSLKMEGTMNWAQPGKMSKLFNFIE